ncbi:hypothetical protein NE237_024717 [Protea cynaroides]|uniref:Uncharacterized protein n=1 Tax=Protea cynaroides TaxID=273540 RepID=A0A9Q0H0F1_9MAGN|nr:hypothetical protein NE237_024717 [Protea cynaroides]
MRAPSATLILHHHRCPTRTTPPPHRQRCHLRRGFIYTRFFSSLLPPHQFPPISLLIIVCAGDKSDGGVKGGGGRDGDGSGVTVGGFGGGGLVGGCSDEGDAQAYKETFLMTMEFYEGLYHYRGDANVISNRHISIVADGWVGEAFNSVASGEAWEDLVQIEEIL